MLRSGKLSRQITIKKRKILKRFIMEDMFSETWERGKKS